MIYLLTLSQTLALTCLADGVLVWLVWRLVG